MSFLTAENINRYGALHGFFTREDGMSSGGFASRNVKKSIGDSDELVIKNRQLCLSELKASQNPFVYARLCHGDAIYHVDGSEKGVVEIEQYDAIISSKPDVVIGLSTADCVPILLADKSQKAVAVIHAGWRGLDVRIIQKTIDQMAEQYSIPIDSIVAAIGPAIHQMSYEVGSDVANRFDERFSERQNDSLYLDLIGIAFAQLQRAGISDIVIQCPDTASDDRFFSYRAENGSTGRQLTAISLTS